MSTPMPMQYRVRYLRVGDAVVRDELLPSASESALRAQLIAQGQTVLSVHAASAPWQFTGLLSLARFTRTQTNRHSFPLFCREVRTLIQAGMTVVEAVETLSARERLEGRTDSLSAILLLRLQQGLALSTALAEMPQTPVVLIAAVRAGERTSNLIEALDDYLRFDSMVTQLRKKIVSAAIYPALVSMVGLGISLFLLLVVMPNFASMYENLRGAAQGGTALTIQLSQLIGKNRAAVFTVLSLMGVGIAFWVVSGKAKAHAAWVGRSVPWIRKRVEDFQLAMMYQALALLLKGGYPMTEAMGVAGQSALSPQLKAALGSAQAAIEQGGSVSQALAQAQLCDEVGRRLMAAAERNGEFHRSADVVSRLHGERFELFVERVTRIVEPLLLLAVALVVGGIVVMMYLPVFDMATQLR
jgi:general secretion pathway protein F